MEDVPVEALIADVVAHPTPHRTDCWPRLPAAPQSKSSRVKTILGRIANLFRKRS